MNVKNYHTRGGKMSYREVTKDEFYSVIAPQDVHPDIEGSYPFTAVFRTRARREVGRIDTDGRYLLVGGPTWCQEGAN